MSHTRYSSDEIAERGQALFDRDIRGKLDASARGKFLVLDIETGEYEIDSDQRAALKRARAKHPEAALYLLRVGHPTAFRLGWKGVSAPTC
jgi:hypothetical protein